MRLRRVLPPRTTPLPALAVMNVTGCAGGNTHIIYDILVPAKLEQF
jgi:hypothetical protein